MIAIFEGDKYVFKQGVKFKDTSLFIYMYILIVIYIYLLMLLLDLIGWLTT